MKSMVFKPSISEDLKNVEQIFDKSYIAALLQVDKAQLGRWEKNRTKPKRENMAKIAGLNYILFRLSENFRHQETMLKWLNGTNAHLNDSRPIDLIRSNRFNEVLSAIDAYETGAFA